MQTKTIERTLLAFIAPLFMVGCWWLNRAFSLPTVCLLAATVIAVPILMWMAAHVGGTKEQKGRVFFYSGAVILVLALFFGQSAASDIAGLVAQLANEKQKLSPEAAASAESFARFGSILGTVFGGASVARGIAYFSDHDLDTKKLTTPATKIVR